jgi:hypothetical protein
MPVGADEIMAADVSTSTPETLFFLERGGVVQRLTTSIGRCFPVAESRKDAVRLCNVIDKPGVRVAKIGEYGDTFEKHVNAAWFDNCSTIICVDGWTDNGSPTWKTYPIVDNWLSTTDLYEPPAKPRRPG